MGLIRLARQVVFGRDVAVKSVRPEVADELTSVELLREAWLIIGMFTLMADGRAFPIPVAYTIGFFVAIFDPGLRFFMMSFGHMVAVITALVILVAAVCR